MPLSEIHIISHNVKETDGIAIFVHFRFNVTREEWLFCRSVFSCIMLIQSWVKTTLSPHLPRSFLYKL